MTPTQLEDIAARLRDLPEVVAVVTVDGQSRLQTYTLPLPTPEESEAGSELSSEPQQQERLVVTSQQELLVVTYPAEGGLLIHDGVVYADVRYPAGWKRPLGELCEAVVHGDTLILLRRLCAHCEGTGQHPWTLGMVSTSRCPRCGGTGEQGSEQAPQGLDEGY